MPPLITTAHCPKNNLNLCLKSESVSWLDIYSIAMPPLTTTAHCPKKNLNLCLKSEPVSWLDIYSNAPPYYYCTLSQK